MERRDPLLFSGNSVLLLGLCCFCCSGSFVLLVGVVLITRHILNLLAFMLTTVCGGNTLRGKGERQKSGKKRTFPPFPYGFSRPRPLFPSPHSPIVRFFGGTGAEETRISFVCQDDRFAGIVLQGRNVDREWSNAVCYISYTVRLVPLLTHPCGVDSSRQRVARVFAEGENKPRSGSFAKRMAGNPQARTSHRQPRVFR